MASNYFGEVFRFTTWGESHGKAIGVLIDGCPAGIEISEAEIASELLLRAPGQSKFTSARQEIDLPEILSGIFEGKTTGAPINMLISNSDARSADYSNLKEVLRPGHANYTYLEKYGIFDYRGGGRASARETAARVAAGAVAKKILQKFDIQILAYLSQVGEIKACASKDDFQALQVLVKNSPIFCPDRVASEEIISLLEQIINEKDSCGGVVTFLAHNVPTGLGDPVYLKCDSQLAKAMLSIPAAKGFEMGLGFAAAVMRGSQHNDLFTKKNNRVETVSNHCGGVLGGITNGMPLWGQVAFKPTSTILKSQETVNLAGEKLNFTPKNSSRHDPCLAIRAVKVVEAMLAVTLVDLKLLNRLAKI